MATNIRPVRRQHTVTKRILMEFADPSGRLAVFDRGPRIRQLRTPGSGIFTTQFDTFDSRGAEERWSILESRFPAAISSVRQGTALGDPATVAALKDLLALHWARSVAIMVARERVTTTALQDHKRSTVLTSPEMVARSMRAETGLVASSQAALEWYSDRVHDQVFAQNSARWNSRRNSVNFAAARTHFEPLHVQVGHAQNHDFLISDCPVISTLEGKVGTGPHQGVAIKEADHIAMPIAPDLVIALGPEPKEHTMLDEVVDRYNSWQWEACETWIAGRPEGVGDMSLKLATCVAPS